MANHFNWGAAFGGAANGLAQGVQVSSQRDLEEMRDQRAENLARFTLGKQMQMEGWKTQYLAQHDKDILERQEKIHSADNAAAEARNAARDEAWAKRSEGQQLAAETRAQMKIDAAEKAARGREINSLRLTMYQEQQRFDEAKRKLMNNIAWATNNNMLLKMKSGDDLKAAQMKDPAIGPMFEQLSDLEDQRKGVIRSLSGQLAMAGDPAFAGVQTEHLPMGTGGTAPGAGDDTQGTATPNNPHDPSIPSLGPNAADNAPAVEPKMPGQNLPNAPGGVNSLIPQTTGMPMRPPSESLVGPLTSRSAIPSLMPGVGSTPQPMGPPSGMNITGGPPSLTPPGY